jgi:hypothetical protein
MDLRGIELEVLDPREFRYGPVEAVVITVMNTWVA